MGGGVSGCHCGGGGSKGGGVLLSVGRAGEGRTGGEEKREMGLVLELGVGSLGVLKQRFPRGGGNQGEGSYRGKTEHGGELWDGKAGGGSCGFLHMCGQ